MRYRIAFFGVNRTQYIGIMDTERWKKRTPQPLSFETKNDPHTKEPKKNSDWLGRMYAVRKVIHH